MYVAMPPFALYVNFNAVKLFKALEQTSSNYFFASYQANIVMVTVPSIACVFILSNDCQCMTICHSE